MLGMDGTNSQRGIILLSLPEKANAESMENLTKCRTSARGGTMWNPSKTWNSEPAFYSEKNPGGGTEAMVAMIFRDQWVNLAWMPGLHTYSFSKDTLRF